MGCLFGYKWRGATSQLLLQPRPPLHTYFTQFKKKLFMSGKLSSELAAQPLQPTAPQVLSKPTAKPAPPQAFTAKSSAKPTEHQNKWAAKPAPSPAAQPQPVQAIERPDEDIKTWSFIHSPSPTGPAVYDAWVIFRKKLHDNRVDTKVFLVNCSSMTLTAVPSVDTRKWLLISRVLERSYTERWWQGKMEQFEDIVRDYYGNLQRNHGFYTHLRYHFQVLNNLPFNAPYTGYLVQYRISTAMTRYEAHLELYRGNNFTPGNVDPLLSAMSNFTFRKSDDL